MSFRSSLFCVFVLCVVFVCFKFDSDFVVFLIWLHDFVEHLALKEAL